MAELPPTTRNRKKSSLTSAPLSCPLCYSQLVPKLEHEIEIDVCPDCQGIWLDRNELDKLLAVSLWELDRYASKISERAIEHSERSGKSLNEVFFGFKNNFGRFLGKLRKSS